MAALPLERAHPITLRLAFAPEPEGARAVSIAIRNFLAENGVPERELFSYELCVAEATNNAVEYAEGDARRLQPVAEAVLTPVLLEFRVTDFTPGFEMPEHVAPPSPLDERGRGLFLIQSVMDEVVYVRGSGENILIMRKRRAAPPSAPGQRRESSGNPLVAKSVTPPGMRRVPQATGSISVYIRSRLMAVPMGSSDEWKRRCTAWPIGGLPVHP